MKKLSIKEFLFSKKYKSIYWYLSYFFGYRMPFSKGWNEYRNPLYHWWKMRKYFKRPKIHFFTRKYFYTFGCPARRDWYNPIISFHTTAVGWKEKYDTPRFEWNPMVQIVFFRKYHLVWYICWNKKSSNFDEVTKNQATWEALLGMLYFNQTIKQARNSNVWESERGKIYIDSNLTKYALDEISKNN